MAKNNNQTTKYGNIEYKMTPEMAEAYLKSRKGEDKKKHPQDFLCDLVNNEFHVKGNCIRVLTTL